MIEEELSKEEGFLRSMDFFRFTPSKFLEQTVFGALLSLAMIAFSIYLILHEVNNVINDEISTEILFENLHINDIELNIDIDITSIPCDITDLRFTAKRGRQHTLKRLRIVRTPNKKDTLIPFEIPRDAKLVAESLKNGEGCKIVGSFYIHLLSNNFYLGFGNARLMAMARNQLGDNWVPNLNHQIHKLTFGPDTRVGSLEKTFNLKGFNSLKNHTVVEDRADGFGGPYYHSYFLTAVPNIFDRMFMRILETFQYTASFYSRRNINSAIVFV